MFHRKLRKNKNKKQISEPIPERMNQRNNNKSNPLFDPDFAKLKKFNFDFYKKCILLIPYAIQQFSAFLSNNVHHFGNQYPHVGTDDVCTAVEKMENGISQRIQCLRIHTKMQLFLYSLFYFCFSLLFFSIFVPKIKFDFFASC